MSNTPGDGNSPSQQTRRGFLRNAALAGGAAAALGTVGASALGTPAFAAADAKTGTWSPDPDSQQFTLAIMPDTQYQFWGSQDSVDAAPLEASLRYLINASSDQNNNVVFMAHLGDMTQDADPTSFKAVGKAFKVLDNHGVAYSVLAGNHDVTGDDSRGDSAYLQTMGPQRFKGNASFVASDPSGYNTAHKFQAAGKTWMVLALDWRTTDAGFAWANDMIKAHPKWPVIVTTHELVGPTYGDEVFPYKYGDPDDNAAFSAYGNTVWDKLINDNDQIFLTVNGHFWPTGRTTRQNAKGNDVYSHIANYQNRYYGGGAMMRLYHFDLARNTIDVETVNPWVESKAPEDRNELDNQIARVSFPTDVFSMPIDFEQRFASFIPPAVRPARPASKELVKGTLAYWRFDGLGADGTSLTAGQKVRDQSGKGNDLTVVVPTGTAADTLTWSADHHPDQPGHASLKFAGGRNPVHGAYLTTVDNAPLNAETFTSGYTIEAFVMIPADWNSGNNGNASMLSRGGSAGEAGKSGKNTNVNEPLAQLNITNNGREVQWNHYPTNTTYPTTNWSHGLPELQWHHIAVVNDGQFSKLYVAGSLVQDNPNRVSIGVTSLNRPWLFGAHTNKGTVDVVFHGNVGDVRIVNRALTIDEFMTKK
ncbi:Tat pathway signal sequence domain protein [Actinoplanes sp. TBRC 11911]|uniref:LamG-like jellyroll fold domain-containing protein n=1 Tax=Actinoplanes sp. TBRC 11911 TaxID=2729386 RepID=UPI00145CD580|nr:LamG-like jellyroll fold domain-containing protein [Actinoplanes sp. TBRC 11911]NMO56756.1 Tat pathway signal sequence domain protein [Actinoplanes sp. TBRC 11911]